jgi:hypothetical protein
VRAQQVLFELLRSKSNTGALVGEVVAQLVTLSHNGTNKLLLALDSFGDEKERCTRPMFPQLVEYEGSRDRVGTVIQGQSEDRFSSRHAVEATGIAFRY